MKQIETNIIIHATPDHIWSVLADFENYPAWNPFIPSISGGKTIGQILEVRIQPPGGSGMTFRPKLLRFDPRKEFRWKGQLFFSGIFDGEHYFTLEEKGENKTLLTHGELFSGLLVGLLGGMLAKTEAGFRLMNEALKAKCEKPSL
ncbi:SRPBCC domain-containing protein [Algoriphagus aestuariicola]|uniref:SRPBCC domain-containing protein n=1 Tax=Algoriphagus aestuariicola TaxID=1852016 RepID=A0ABS3BVN0_9BACT|nr:SRPBCC domain-containing protein [Algoriphagus aestuariicola]MBN7803327.1 SRPBCC domain-containing protein [Algoriphagus aestuariicola]